jgi:hypothetical protein
VVITNSGIVAGTIVALVFLLAGILLWRRSPSGGGVIVTAGALLTLAAEVYGMIVLKPYIGRSYDEQWYQQITTIETIATLGLLVCAAGVVAHGLKLAKR